MATFIPVCTDIPSKAILPTFTDSYPVVFYYHGGECYSIHREHVGLFDIECRSADSRSFEQLMATYVSKYVEGAAASAAAAAVASPSEKTKKSEKKKGFEGAAGPEVSHVVGVTIGDLCKLLGCNPEGPDRDRSLLSAAIQHAKSSNAEKKNHIDDMLLSSNPQEFGVQWKNLAWMLLTTAAEKLAQRLFAPEEHPDLYALCAAFMGACEAAYLSADTVASFFKPLLCPVRYINTKQRMGFVNLDIYKGPKTSPMMTWSVPSDATSGCCDPETWMTYMGPSRPHIFTHKGRQTLTEESIFTLAQSPQYVAKVQDLMEASLSKQSEFTFSMLNTQVSPTDLASATSIISLFFLQELTMAKTPNNIVWLKDVKPLFVDPSEFSLPDGQEPANPKTDKSWGKATYAQVKALLGKATSWQSVDLLCGIQARLSGALEKLSFSAIRKSKVSADKHFTNISIPDRVVKNVVASGEITRASFAACSEKAMFLEGKDEHKINDITSETIKILKYKLGMRIESFPQSIVGKCMVFKFCSVVEYVQMMFACLRGPTPGLPIMGYTDLASLRTDGRPFRAVELRGMVSAMEKCSFELACTVAPKNDENPAACVGFRGFVPRTTGFRCPVIKSAGANASPSSVSHPDSYEWAERIVARATPEDKADMSKLMREIADLRMHTLITSAMAGMNTCGKAVSYLRPFFYTITGSLIPYSALLEEKFNKAPCFPQITFDCFTGAKTYIRCLWPDQRPKGKRGVQGPIVTLQNPRNMFVDAYFSSGAGDIYIQPVQMSERVSDAVMVLQHNRTVTEEDLDEYDLDPESKCAVVDILVKSGVQYVGASDARASRKRAISNEESTSSTTSKYFNGVSAVAPAESKRPKSGGDILDEFLSN
ncbi:protein ORF88 [Cyprinid herpesvirus 1]|uniref:Protein ORF88 n=1 Tax=Cyprinid herpesvirus 1 TaxID=317858 RepID=K7PCK9_9VIRU|nr:protein ORF88 [Cyprinid herpesvirus 1]AFJ20385.1 protein ORF88 [Cyprinid herpesvirus 1]